MVEVYKHVTIERPPIDAEIEKDYFLLAVGEEEPAWFLFECEPDYSEAIWVEKPLELVNAIKSQDTTAILSLGVSIIRFELQGSIDLLTLAEDFWRLYRS